MTLQQEHHDHGDVLQHDFIDSFVNLTLKTTFLMKWVLSNNCSTAKFVFKTDDDAVVNPEQVLTFNHFFIVSCHLIFFVVAFKLWNTLDHALLHTTTTKALRSFIATPPTALPISAVHHGAEPLEAANIVLSESIDYLIMGHQVCQP